MYFFNSRNRINFSFLTLAVVLIVFVSMSSGVINSSANSNNNQSNPAATFIVNNNGDTPDSNTADGLCLDANGNCTLRAAVEQANASASDDVITFLPAVTTVVLTIGEIVISNNGSLQINGNGANVTTIDGGAGTNRIFFSSGNVVISRVNLTGGNASGTFLNGYGGAILAGGESLLLDSIFITGNTASERPGGGVYFLNGGKHYIINSTFSANSANLCGGFANDRHIKCN